MTRKAGPGTLRLRSSLGFLNRAERDVKWNQALIVKRGETSSLAVAVRWSGGRLADQGKLSQGEFQSVRSNYFPA